MSLMGISNKKNIAYFVSPHGYGHAARSSAIMQEILNIKKDVHFHLFTLVPDWFFKDSINKPYSYHPLLTDVGLVQNSPLQVDLPSTIEMLDQFMDFHTEKYGKIIGLLQEIDCQLILSDISPLGLYLANHLKIPSVLIENFTWDWIYVGYLNQNKEFKKHIDYLSDIYASADYHIQTDPICRPICHADLHTQPVSRSSRLTRETTRNRLGLSENEPVVMITMGGIQTNYDFLEDLKQLKDMLFLIPGANNRNIRYANIITLPHHSDYFHPDLIQASDAVIGKIGYSTLAEVYNLGKPYGYIPRDGFRESQIVEKFIQEKMNGIRISEHEFYNVGWIDKARHLLNINPKYPDENENGAAQAAEYICKYIMT